MTILIVDDEALARQRILKLLNTTDYFSKIIEASSGKEAIESINKLQIDLVFLDIKMTDLNGFDVLKKIDSKTMPIIIFVTAFDSFAVKAFEVKAIDFLLKPYKTERFYEALNRAITKISQKDLKQQYKSKIANLINYIGEIDTNINTSPSSYIEKVVLKTGKKFYFIKTETIKYITSSAYYAEIFTKDNSKHIYRISMSDFIKKLDPNTFNRINRSTIINNNDIKEVISEGQGDYSIIMNDKKIFSLSSKYKSDFLKSTKIK
ncbi:LytTR family DNA-binding domain-containing protein [uncultured Lacinutrix sp.]|uniref:LytR/AlgR family response regulator transcription factor n=1 Tax=uncultured Lacinutrix sp. TaxID=574032 RepID=UPI00262F31D1|nr:response regulator transcription factor [uncultured Lacinutrix sp.]